MPAITNLSQLTTSLENFMAQPGRFTEIFPGTSSTDLLDVLKDALAEAHLEGLLLSYDSDDLGVLTDVNDDPVSMPDADWSLVLLMAGSRFIRSVLLNRPSSREYVAGKASFREEQSTNILRDIMKDLKAQKAQIVANQSATLGTAGAYFGMADQYAARAFGSPYDFGS